MGASIGRALVARRACRRVLGVSRKRATLRAAMRLRAAHETLRDPAEACARADLVILATPARTIARLIPVAASVMKPGSLLTDVGSTKGEICRRAEGSLRRSGIRFIGGHPMAGQSGSGPLSSNPRLFSRRPYVITPTRTTRPGDVRLASELARAVGAVPLRLDPAAHDRAVALISHMPHVLAVALVLQAAASGTSLPLRLAAGSFKGATRVASSDTDMLLDILLTNRSATGRSLSAFRSLLRSFERAIQRGDESWLRRRLSHARRIRNRV